MPLTTTQARQVLAAARAVLAASLLRQRSMDGRGRAIPVPPDYLSAAQLVAGTRVDDMDVSELIAALGEEA